MFVPAQSDPSVHLQLIFVSSLQVYTSPNMFSVSRNAFSEHCAQIIYIDEVLCFSLSLLLKFTLVVCTAASFISAECSGTHL